MSLQPLIPPERRRAALATAGLAALVVVVLAVLLHGGQDNGVDDSITDWIHLHLGSGWMARASLWLSEPALDVAVLAPLAAVALLRRKWNIAALVVLGPAAAVLVSELALKPLVHRQLGYASGALANAYPSGHETGVAAVITVLAVLVLRSGWRASVEIAVVAVLASWALVAAVGLVGMHYPSDTVGGAGVAVALVLATALAIDAVTGRRRSNSPDVRDRPRRAHAV